MADKTRERIVELIKSGKICINIDESNNCTIKFNGSFFSINNLKYDLGEYLTALSGRRVFFPCQDVAEFKLNDKICAAELKLLSLVKPLSEQKEGNSMLGKGIKSFLQNEVEQAFKSGAIKLVHAFDAEKALVVCMTTHERYIGANMPSFESTDTRVKQKNVYTLEKYLGSICEGVSFRFEDASRKHPESTNEKIKSILDAEFARLADIVNKAKLTKVGSSIG